MQDDEGGRQLQELSFGTGLAEAAGGGGGQGRALQLSLPAQLGMEPEDLQRIRWVDCDCWGKSKSTAGSMAQTAWGGACVLPGGSGQCDGSHWASACCGICVWQQAM